MGDIVRAVHKGRQHNMARFFAERLGAKVLDDEPTTNPDGTPRPATSASGRPAKRKTTVDEASTEKKAVASADDKKEKDQ